MKCSVLFNCWIDCRYVFCGKREDVVTEVSSRVYAIELLYPKITVSYLSYLRGGVHVEPSYGLLE
jgi:hypothetical protein